MATFEITVTAEPKDGVTKLTAFHVGGELYDVLDSVLAGDSYYDFTVGTLAIKEATGSTEFRKGK